MGFAENIYSSYHILNVVELADIIKQRASKARITPSKFQTSS